MKKETKRRKNMEHMGRNRVKKGRKNTNKKWKTEKGETHKKNCGKKVRNQVKQVKNESGEKSENVKNCVTL